MDHASGANGGEVTKIVHKSVKYTHIMRTLGVGICGELFEDNHFTTSPRKVQVYEEL